MTMEVRGPGGIVVRFPDGTDPAMIDKVMREAVGGAVNSATMAAGPVKSVQTSTYADIVKSAGRGALEGAAGLVGLPGDLASGADWIGNKAYDAVSGMVRGAVGKPLTQEQQASIEKARRDLPRPLPRSSDVIGAVDTMTGGNLRHQPQTTAGEYARTAGSFVPGAGLFGGAKLSSVLGYGVAPGLASEAGGQVFEGTRAEPYARIAGAAAGGVVPVLVRRAVTPFRASAARQSAAKVMKGEGVDLTAGQATGNTALKYAESELGGASGARLLERQGEQFTAAVLKRAGIKASRATPDVIDDAFRTIGDKFNRLSASSTLVPDRKFAGDLRDALKYYSDRVALPNRAPIIANYADEIANVSSGAIPGEAYQSLRSRISADARTVADPYVANTLRDLAGALDDAMGRSLGRSNPSAVGAWQEARRQYRNLLVIEKSATGAGENSALGIISPAQLRNATTTQSRRAYARGKGDFAELARSGEATMKPMPNSGTPGRLKAQAVIGLPAALGATVGASTGDIYTTLLGAILGGALPSGVGKLMLSKPGRAFLANQLLKPVGGVPKAMGALLTNTSLPSRLSPPSK